MKAFTEALQHELRNTPSCKVSAHLLVPGFVFTPLTAKGRSQKPAGAWTPDETVDFMLSRLEVGDFYIFSVPTTTSTGEPTSNASYGLRAISSKTARLSRAGIRITRRSSPPSLRDADGRLSPHLHSQPGCIPISALSPEAARLWMTSWSRRSRGCKLCSSLHDAALSGRDDRGPEACQTALSHQVSRGRSSRAEQREVRDRVEDFTKSEIQKCHHSTIGETRFAFHDGRELGGERCLDALNDEAARARRLDRIGCSASASVR